MQKRRIVPVLGFLATAAPSVADAPPGIGIESSTAVVVIRPLPERQRLIRLPALTYSMVINAECGSEREIDSVSISIADTTRTLASDAFAEGAEAALEITVPDRQVSPLAVDGFCRAGEAGDTAPAETHIDNAVTAHLSLRCAGRDARSIVYASKPLGVTLRCEGDQAPSELSVTR